MQDVGWREKVKLPQISKKSFTAKMDTGAKASSLHVTDLNVHEKNGERIASFTAMVGPKPHVEYVKFEAEVIEYKRVRSSNGMVEERPTIILELELNGERWPVEVTLTNRSKMKYRMLIGRDAMGDKLRICPSKTYLTGD